MSPARYGNYSWIPGYFEGEDCFIVASGPSIRAQFGREACDGNWAFDFSPLKGKRVIVISHVLHFIPEPDIMVILDSSPLRTLGRDHYTKPYKTVSGRNTNFDPKGQVAVVNYSKKLNLDPKHGFFGSYSTGHFAISVALCAKASNIYLIGFDCRAKRDDGNFYNTKLVKGYARNDPEARYARMAKGFETFKDCGNIYHLSCASDLHTFETILIDDILDMSLVFRD